MKDCETAFRAALLQAEAPVPRGLVDGLGRPAGRRYAVYRNNVAVALREALETGFPAVAKLIGPENFAHVAARFLRSSPPGDPRMMFYGAGFPTFLAGIAPLARLGYLPDVAQLELALRQSYHAADAPPLDPARLQGLDEATLMGARLVPAPALQLIRSDWPVLSVHRFTLVAGAPKPAAGAEDVLVTRPALDPQMHLLGPGAGRFVAALLAGAPFGDALEAAGDGFDLSATLSLLLSAGALTDLFLPRP
ncbi:HvfC/BufC N-terminal domain-containing protein [Pseudoponticoccus marisrubri]|uniref:Putative DNA-binding domain-containing protein n=1 Tax=Pseudoponticoccus marisrubri TaxID=1685382 RepID=A0A0W7WNG0_9RHOB|nr:DNA-binding domain-containing protein [Pseudoponticoccus marisrubri]KUF12090.1 hypothetical protein AVJ23_05835 [Pseudoponticoccus marisrubri]